MNTQGIVCDRAPTWKSSSHGAAHADSSDTDNESDDPSICGDRYQTNRGAVGPVHTTKTLYAIAESDGESASRSRRSPRATTTKTTRLARRVATKLVHCCTSLIRHCTCTNGTEDDYVESENEWPENATGEFVESVALVQITDGMVQLLDAVITRERAFLEQLQLLECGEWNEGAIK